MTKSEALRVFVAAHDDPILAAWAAVAHEHKVSPMIDVSPYEYWEAFQELYSHGLISPEQFDGVDARQVFFSGRRPPVKDVLRVLDNLRKLPDHHHQEPPPMTRTKLPDNPFATNGTDNSSSLVARSNGELAGGRTPAGLPSRQASPGLNPFSNHEVLPPSKDPATIPMTAFSQQSGLACRDSGGQHNLSPGRNMDVKLQVYCCDQLLQMEVADMQAEGPDSIPGGQISITDRVLHGTCRVCNREHHHSVGEVTHANIY